MKTRDQAAVQNIVLKAHLAGLLYVPPVKYTVPSGFQCTACSAIGERQTGCLPPFGLRKAEIHLVKA